MIAQKQEKDKREFFIGYGADMDPDIPEITDRFRRAVFPAIMQGSNAHALDILRERGIPGVIPGIGPVCIPHDYAAKFYDVSPDYLRNLMTNRTISKRKFSDDIKYITPDLLPKEVRKCGRSAGTMTEFVYADELRDSLAKVYGLGVKSIKVPSTGFTAYSPRLVLALSMVFAPGRVSSLPVVSDMLRRIKKSTYRSVPVVACSHNANDYPSAELKSDTIEMPQVSDGIPVLSNGSMVLSPDIFTHMIKTAVKEAVSEVVSQLGIPVKPTTEPKPPTTQKKRGGFGCSTGMYPKLKKPDNWDDVLSKWLSGEITQKKAASLTGMCVTSFQKYAHGAKKF